MIKSNDPFVGMPSPESAVVPRTTATLPRVTSDSVPPLPTSLPEVPPLILIIDDEAALLKTSELIYRSTKLKDFADLETFELFDGAVEALIENLKSRADAGKGHNAIYVDLNLDRNPGGGIELIKRLRSEIPSLRYTPFAIITAYPDEDAQRSATDSRILRFIVKTDPNPTGHAIVGQFLHRLILETPELISQAEDQLWFDLNERVANHRAKNEKNTDQICQDVAEFLSDHFAANAIYTRRLEADGTLAWMAGIDGLRIKLERLPLTHAPFLQHFVTSNVPFQIVDRLTPHHLSDALPPHVRDCRALVARMSVGQETVGLITVYRGRKERRFRPADGHFLYHLAQQLGASHYHEQQVATFHRRQTELVRFVNGLADLHSEGDIFETLATLLFERIARTAKGQVRVTVRKILPGSIDLLRAVPAKGFELDAEPPKLTLKMFDRSTVASAINEGRPLLRTNMPLEIPGGYAPSDSPFVSGLAVPIISEGVCIGAANLESTAIAAFTDEDRDFADILCGTAGTALIRLRARHFNLGMLGLLSKMSVDAAKEPADIIQFAVKLLFDFAGYAELLYLEPIVSPATADPAWKVTFAYGREGRPLGPEDRLKWQAHLHEVWPQTYLRKCISGGERVAYTDDQNMIESDTALRAGNGGKTQAQAVVLIRDAECGPPLAAIAVLFVQKHALNSYQLEFLKQFGRLLGDWFLHQSQIGRILGMLTVRDQEARLGQVYGQVRHSLSSRMALIRQYVKRLSTGQESVDTAGQKIMKIADWVSGEIDRNRNIIKRPEAKEVCLNKIWLEVRDDLAGIAEEYQGTIDPGSLAIQHWTTDPDILRTVLFNLADNALRYGGAGVLVRLEAIFVDNRLHLDIVDTGHGIAATVLPKLFDPGVTTGRSATGMGLYLSKLRAGDLGGDLVLINSDSSGSRFRIVLPALF